MLADRDLLNKIKEQAPSDSYYYHAIEQAFNIARVVHSNLDEKTTPYIIRLARRIAINTLRDEDDFYNLTEDIDIGYRDIVTSDYVISKISHWVAKVREELFDSTEPPFYDDHENAVRWVEDTAKLDGENENASQGKESLPFLKSEIYLPYQNSVKPIWVQPGSLLYHLGKKALSISQATGFRKHAVTIYILTGLEPVFPRVTMQINYGRAVLPQDNPDADTINKEKLTISSKSLCVNIYAADLSPGELKEIYDGYRRELKLNKMKSLSEDQVKLFYLVHNAGGPPKYGSKAFWNEIKKQWNNIHGNKPYKSWEGVYQRYKIVVQKMDSLYFKK